MANIAQLGGAVDIEQGASGLFLDSAFISNYGSTHGGAIFISPAGGTAYVSRTEFDNNTAAYGGDDIFNMHADPNEVQCPSTCDGENCTTIDCYECTCYSCTCYHPTPQPTSLPTSPPTLGATPSPTRPPSPGPAVCSDDSTCTVCDTCCVDYLPDQASCDECTEEQC